MSSVDPTTCHVYSMSAVNCLALAVTAVDLFIHDRYSMSAVYCLSLSVPTVDPTTPDTGGVLHDVVEIVLLLYAVQ